MPLRLIPYDSTGAIEKAGEGCTARMKFKARDYQKANLPQGSLTVATLRIINAADGTEIHDFGDVISHFNADGDFSLIIDAAYNKILSTDEATQEELHLGLIHIEGTDGQDDIEINAEYYLFVTNFEHVTT